MDGVPAAGFEDVEETHDIGVDVGGGVFQGVTHPGLGGQVADRVEFFLCKQAPHPCPVGQVQLDKAVVFVAGAPDHVARGNLFPGNAGFGQAGILEVDVVVGVDVVQADDFVAAGKQAFGEVEADEAGGSRN